MTGVQIAYYVVHSLGKTGAFEEADRQAAHTFGASAREAGVSHLISLGGLGKSRARLSAHLQSRQEAGDILRAYGVQVIEFLASTLATMPSH